MIGTPARMAPWTITGLVECRMIPNGATPREGHLTQHPGRGDSALGDRCYEDDAHDTFAK